MKFKFYVLIAAAVFLVAFTHTAGAELIPYNNVDEFEGSFEGVTDFELVSLPFGGLGNDSTIVYKAIDDNDFIIEFLEDNTAFGAMFNKVTVDSPASVTISMDGMELSPFSVEVGGRGNKGFFGITTGGDGYIDYVKVELGNKVNVTNVYHNNPMVPEPTTLMLLGSGLIGLVGLGRKKFFRKP